MQKPDSSHEPAPAALPDHWMTRIFSVLRSTYGAAFDRQWECPPGQDPALYAQQLRRHWAVELRAYGREHTAPAIAWALEHLPPAPPNLVEFKALCRSAPRPVVAAISHSRSDRSRVASELQRIAEVTERLRNQPGGNARNWAYRLAERAREGLRLTLDQKRALIDAGVIKPEEPRT